MIQTAETARSRSQPLKPRTPTIQTTLILIASMAERALSRIRRMALFGSAISHSMVAVKVMGLSGSDGQIKGRGKKVRRQTVSGLMGELENE